MKVSHLQKKASTRSFLQVSFNVKSNQHQLKNYFTALDNQLSGSEGVIGNQLYPTPYPTGDFLSYSWLVTTNTSTIIELKFLELFPQGSSTTDCYGTVIKVRINLYQCRS